MNRQRSVYLFGAFPTLYSELSSFDCGDGWYKIIKDLSAKLEPILVEYKTDDPDGWKYGLYRAAQVKEKFGTLRFYLDGGTEACQKFIREAEVKSAKTCELCGKPGKLRRGNWFRTLCQKHYEKYRGY